MCRECVRTVQYKGNLHSSVLVQKFCMRETAGIRWHHGFLRSGKETFWDLDAVNVIRLNLILGTTPLSGSYRVIQGLYAARGGEFCSRTTFIHGCWHILRSLDVDLYRCFNCPHCGSLDTAPIVIADGNAKMACRREYTTPRYDSVIRRYLTCNS